MTRLALAVVVGLTAAFPDGFWFVNLNLAPVADRALAAAAASVVTVGIAERRDEPIGSWCLTKVGLPFALASLVVASLYVWLRDLAF